MVFLQGLPIATVTYYVTIVTVACSIIIHVLFDTTTLPILLKLINDSCSSYPTRESYSGQVDGFRNTVKNKLKTMACLEIISNTDANFANQHIDKARKTINNFI